MKTNFAPGNIPGSFLRLYFILIVVSASACNLDPRVAANNSNGSLKTGTPAESKAGSADMVKSNVGDSISNTTNLATTKPGEVSRMSGPEEILKRKEVPILCYHHIKNWTLKTSARAKDYIVPVSTFEQQLKMLADSGYQTILPDQLFAYLAYNAPLPPKPVMLTFDDTDLEQFTVARPEMNKYGFKGVFFIMTVSLNRPNYMTRDQVRALSDEGHEIGSHTWDHRNVKKYQEADWKTQIEKPTGQLSAITGKPVRYFAYPFGLWNPAAIPELKKRGFAAAFQLSTSRDQEDPVYTIRRIIVPGSWDAKDLHRSMHNSFR